MSGEAVYDIGLATPRLAEGGTAWRWGRGLGGNSVRARKCDGLDFAVSIESAAIILLTTRSITAISTGSSPRYPTSFDLPGESFAAESTTSDATAFATAAVLDADGSVSGDRGPRTARYQV